MIDLTYKPGKKHTVGSVSKETINYLKDLWKELPLRSVVGCSLLLILGMNAYHYCLETEYVFSALYVIITCGVVFLLCSLISYYLTFRLMPNLAIAAAWTIMLTVFISVISPNSITLVSLLDEAFFRSQIDSGFISTFLSIYGIGTFATAVASLRAESSRAMWSEEMNAENKTILSQFKRMRRHRIQRFQLFSLEIDVLYLCLFCYVVMFVVSTFLALALQNKEGGSVIRVQLILLLFSLSTQTLGICTHFTISDGELIEAEQKYLENVKPEIGQLLDQTELSIDSRFSNYLHVLVNTYCNHNAIRKRNQKEFFLPFENQPKNRLHFAVELIAIFDRVYHSYIEPNEEKYYISARKTFEPELAKDLMEYLIHDIDNNPTSIAEALSIAMEAFFEKQKKEWEGLLYSFREPYLQFKALLLMDLLRDYYRNIQYSGNWADAEELPSTAVKSFLLEFPYRVEQCIRTVYGRISEHSPVLGDKSFSQFYQERVEYYFWELFACSELQCETSENCKAISQNLHSFFQKEYVGEELYLRRLFPINDGQYARTKDTPYYSICWSKKTLNDVEDTFKNKENLNPNMTPQYKKIKMMQELPGWEAIVRNEKYAERERLVSFDQLSDSSPKLNRGLNCCVDAEERMYALAVTIFYKMN